MGYVDAHAHVWTGDTAAYPLAPGYGVSDMVPPSSTPEELFGHCRPCGVDRVVLIQMSFYGLDNRYMLDAIATYPDALRGVAVVDPHRPDLAEEAQRLRDAGVRGFRVYPGPAPASDWLRDGSYDALFCTAGRLGMAVCPLIDPEYLSAVGWVAERHPETTIVVDHLARVGMRTMAEQHIEDLCALADHPNCLVKVSAFYALGARKSPHDDLAPLIRRVYDAFGPGRLMWATDCPYQVMDETYEDSIGLIRERLDFLGPSDRQSLLCDTAERVFFGA